MRYFPLVFLFSCITTSALAQIYEVGTGTINFHSDAPQELIRASTNMLKGYIDLNKKTFAFKVGIASFIGFNSPLQREHFNENYMESTVYPEASFLGKIIEDVDLRKEGTFKVRAKGKLKIHGVEQERIISSVVVNKGGTLSVRSEFVIPLADHSIKIPRIVYEKLAPDINVSVAATMQPKQ